MIDKSENICGLCNSRNIINIHKGVRDNPQIDVLKCNSCGLVFLSSTEEMDAGGYYENGGMHSGINEAEIDFDIWRKNSYKEDLFRATKIISEIENNNSKIMDFGCGNGGFLNIMNQKGFQNVFGVELEDNARNQIKSEGIIVKKTIDEYKEKFDCITMFHVIEHLTDAKEYLSKINEHMYEGGAAIY